ncbi:MAG: hypothetical protein ACJASQ_003063 [Crocinitomicaceae bacterium]|jgi:hypothetical protein
MAKQVNPLDAVIANITADKLLLTEKNTVIEKAKEEKKIVENRIKEYRKDLSVFIKYATEEQVAQIEELGLDVSETSSKGALNPFSQIALDALTEAKGNKMTNGKLYDAYIDSLGKEEEAETYSIFNVKLRQLFSQGRIVKKQIDPTKPSRDDIISLVLDNN